MNSCYGTIFENPKFLKLINHSSKLYLKHIIPKRLLKEHKKCGISTNHLYWKQFPLTFRTMSLLNHFFFKLNEI